jgi:hypothetical protein
MATARDHRLHPWFQLAAMSLVTIYGLTAVKEVNDWYDMASQTVGEQIEHGLRRWLLATVPLFVGWSLAILAMGLLSRRGRRIWRRPSVVPGMVVLLFTVRNVIESAVLGLRWRGSAPLEFWWLLRLVMPTPAMLVTISHSAGVAVASSWLALWIGGWWHAAPSWNDRAGRSLGCYWIAICLVDPFYLSLL